MLRARQRGHHEVRRTFSNLAASLLAQSLKQLSALPASFCENHFDSLQAATQSSDLRNKAKQTSLPSRASCRLVEVASTLDFSSNNPTIESLERSRHCKATWTFPTVMPLPNGPSSSNILLNNQSGVDSDASRGALTSTTVRRGVPRGGDKIGEKPHVQQNKNNNKKATLWQRWVMFMAKRDLSLDKGEDERWLSKKQDL